MTTRSATANRKGPTSTNPRFEFDELSADVLLTADEVAAVLGLSRHTIKSWRRLRQGPPATKLGRAVRYGVGDLRSWLAACKKSA